MEVNAIQIALWAADNPKEPSPARSGSFTAPPHPHPPHRTRPDRATRFSMSQPTVLVPRRTIGRRPLATGAVAPVPVSCPSKLQHSAKTPPSGRSSPGDGLLRLECALRSGDDVADDARPSRPRLLESRKSRQIMIAPYGKPVSPSGRIPGENFGAMRARQRMDPYSPGGAYAPENMILREEHPLNAGNKGKHCIGLAGKRYCRYDYVKPILDSMQLMYASMGWVPPSPVRDDAPPVRPIFVTIAAPAPTHDQLLSDQLQAFGVADAALPAPSPHVRPICVGCGTTDPNDLDLTSDNDRMVCRCGTVCDRVFKSQHREKNCTEDEDKTTHADKQYEPKTDRFNQRGLSADERRKEREREARAGGFMTKKQRETLGVGYAHEQITRHVAQANRRREELTLKEQTKEGKIIEAVDKLFDKLGTISREVQRHIRFSATTAWHAACAHKRICKAGKQCQLDLGAKGPPVIAESMLCCVLQKMMHGSSDTVEGTTSAHIIALNDRFQAQTVGSGQGAAQRAVRTMCSRLLNHGHRDSVIEGCIALSSPAASEEASPVAKGGPVAFVRSNTNLEDTSNSTSEIVKLRDCVNQIFKMLPELPLAVQQGALQALQSVEFQASLHEARTGAMRSMPLKAMSYVILESSRRTYESSGGAASLRMRAPSRLLSSLGLNPTQVEDAVLSVRSFLPAHVFKPAAAYQDDDGLF